MAQQQWHAATSKRRRCATGVAAALLMVCAASSLASAAKLQGVQFSILTPDEQDGTPTCLSLDRVRSNLDVLVRLASRILLPSIGTCLEQTRLVLSTAEAHGLRVYLGMDARGSSSAYHAALMTLSKVAQSHHSTIGAVLVGSGAISDHGVSPADLLEYVQDAKRVASPFYIPVSTSEPWSLWANGPHMAIPGGLIHELDFIGVSIQPWLEGVPVSCGDGSGRGCLDAVTFTATTAARLTSLGKAVVVTETGWPSNGNRCCAMGNAGTGSEYHAASVANANKYLNDLAAFAPKASHDKINYFFSGVFDSPSGLRGLCPDVEGCEDAPKTYQQHWGIFDPSSGAAKSGFDLSSVLDAAKPAVVVATSHAQALSSGRPARSGRGSSDVILPSKIAELMSAGSRVDHVLGYAPAAKDAGAADAAVPQAHAAAAKATTARRSRRLREVEAIHPPPPPPAPPRTFRLDTLAYQPADPTRGWCVDAEHLQADMAVLAGVADGLRLFSFSVCNSQNLQILNLASQQNMKVMIGLTVRDPDYAEIELANLAANVDQWHHVISAVLVDCEAIQAKVMTVPQMAEWMKRVKAVVGKYGIPVTTADGWGIWANATNAAILGPVADLIGVQNHPYWGGTDIQHAARQTLHNIRKLYNFTADYGTKKVLLTETGWPTGGENCCPWSNPPMKAVPGEDSLQMFMNDFASLAKAPDIAEWLHGYIFFEAFDADAKRLLNDGEGVKCNIPCTVEYHWGLFRNEYNVDAGTFTRVQKEAVTPLLFAINDWRPSPPPLPPKPSPPPSPGPTTPRPYDAPNMPTSPPAPEASACNGNFSWYCSQCHPTAHKAGLPQLIESCHLCVVDRNKYGGDYQCIDCFKNGFTAQQVVDCMACVMRGNAGWKCINFCSTNDTSINRDCQKCVLNYNSWYTKKPGYEWECAQLQWYCENTESVKSVGGQKQCRSCISQGWGNSYNCQECAARATPELRQGCIECLRDGGQFWEGCNNAEPKPVLR